MRSMLEWRVLAAALPLLILPGCVARPTWHGDEGTAYDILNQSTIALMDIDQASLDGPVGAAMRQACAVFVFPGAHTGVHAGSAARGAGLLVARGRPSAHWNGPAFYSLQLRHDGSGDRTDARGWLVTVGCDAMPRLHLDAAEREAKVEMDGMAGSDISAWTLSTRTPQAASLESVALRPLPLISMAYYQVSAPLQAILIDRSVHNDASAEILSAMEIVAR